MSEGKISIGVARSGIYTGLALALIGLVYGIGLMGLRTVLPAQLEIVEGKTLCAAYEVSLGHPLYGDPSQQGAATLCTPLYFLVLGGLLKVLPPLFLWGRLLSLAATLITGGILAGYFIKSRFRNGKVALITGALFVSTAWTTDWAAVLCRPDALCHAVWVVALALVVRGGTIPVMVAAILFVVAFGIKQTAILAVPGALLFLWVCRRRQAVVFMVTGVFAALAAYALFRGIMGPWFDRYVLGRAAEQVGRAFPLAALLRNGLLVRAMPAVLAGVVVAALGWRDYHREPAYCLAWFSLPFLLAGSVLTASAYMAGPNSLMPGWYGLVFLAGFGVDRVVRCLDGNPRAIWAGVLALALQVDANAPYHISKSLGRFDQGFIRLVAFLRAEGGTMYCPSDNVVTLLAGHHNYGDRLLAHEMGLQVPGSIRWYREKLNAGETDWLIIHPGEIPADEIHTMTREVYMPVGVFGDWEVWWKKVK